MIRPRRGILTSATGPNLFVQAAPLGTSGFFTVEPTNISGANTWVNAYNGGGAVAGNEVGMNFQTAAAGAYLHAKFMLPMPFTNGLYLLAGTNNIDWIYYIWDQNINLESLINFGDPATETVLANAVPIGGTRTVDLTIAPAGMSGWLALCPASDLAGAGPPVLPAATGRCQAYDGNGVAVAVANQIGFMTCFQNNAIYTPMGHPWPFSNGARLVLDNDQAGGAVTDWIAYVWGEQIAL